MKKNTYLEKLYNSKKPFIIYKVKDGYDLFTDFSKKIFLNNNNINNFLIKIDKNKYKNKNGLLDLYIGFFGYEILCNLNDVKIYVVSPSENFEEFMSEFEKKNGTDSYIAISVKDYENLSKNFAELRRYIEQQKEIIVYYEDAVTNEPETENR